MVCDTPPSQDVSTDQIWNSYLKEYRRYGPDTKARRTVQLLYATQSSFGGIKTPLNLILIPQLFFVIKMSAFYVCLIYSSALQIRCSDGSKQYEPHQTAREHSLIWVHIV